ncbi:MAG: hypothetical protein ACYC9J_06475 [Sulfuricaulis sp.]
MQTLATLPCSTSTMPSSGVVNTCTDKSLKTMHMLIRGDTPMNGAIVELIDNNQAKLLARAIHFHLAEEEVIQADDTALVHGCFYQFFSLMNKQFSLLERMTQATRLSPTTRRCVGLSSATVDPAEADMEGFIHRQHKRVEASDIRAPYYLLPVYVIANDNILASSEQAYAREIVKCCVRRHDQAAIS